MPVTSLKKGILALADERDHITFVEVTNKFPDEVGNIVMSAPNYENIILWGDLSKDLSQAISEIIEEEKLFLHVASEITYAIDGGGMKYPVAKSFMKYKEPRWLPVTLDKSRPKGTK